METTITATELSRSLSDILSRVRYKGETFIVERNGVPVATLAPPVPAKRMTLRVCRVPEGAPASRRGLCQGH